MCPSNFPRFEFKQIFKLVGNLPTEVGDLLKLKSGSRNGQGFLNSIMIKFPLFLVKKRGLIIVITIYLISSILWSVIAVLKMQSFHAYVYDLGALVSSSNSIARTDSLSKLLNLVPSTKPFIFLLSYITLLSPNPTTFLILQPFCVLLASVFIYLIAEKKFGSTYLSLLLSFSFIFFFPISWYLFFDFHIAGFFSTFFFAGLYFLDRKPRISVGLFFLAALTSIIFAFFLLVFLFIKLLDEKIKFSDNAKKSSVMSNKMYGGLLVTPLFTILYSLFELHLSGIETANSGITPTTHGITQLYVNNFLTLISNGSVILILMGILFIVIFVAIAGIKNSIYAISILPVLAFILFAGYPFGNIKAQYNGEYFTPLLFFLILVTSKNKVKTTNPEGVHKSMRLKNIHHKGVLVFVILVICMGLFYNPYGPLNSPSLPGENAFANFYHQLNVTPSDKTANEFVKLVPENATVLVQDNEPQYSARPRNFLFGPGNLPWLNSSFFYDDGPVPKSVIPQYMAVDVNGYVNDQGWYKFLFYNGTDGSMSTWFPYFYSHYDYGLIGYSYPFYLYKLNYSGEPSITELMNFIGSQYVDHQSSIVLHTFNGSFTNLTLPNTAYKLYLLPGSYQFSIKLFVSQFSGNLSLQVTNSSLAFSNNFSFHNKSGNIYLTLNYSISSPSNFTFKVAGSGLNGDIIQYLSEDLGVFYKN